MTPKHSNEKQLIQPLAMKSRGSFIVMIVFFSVLNQLAGILRCSYSLKIVVANCSSFAFFFNIFYMSQKYK